MLATHLQYTYAPVNVSADSASHGGRLDASNRLTSGERNSVFTDINSVQRAAGWVRYGKRFRRVPDPDDQSLTVAKLYLVGYPQGDDWSTLFLGTATDVLGDYTGWDTGTDTETKYGIGLLASDAAVDDLSIVVNVPDASLATGSDAIFRVGDEVRIYRTGVELFREIDSVSVSGTEVTLGLTSALTYDFTVSAGTTVASVIDLDTIETSFAVVSSSGGAAYDTATYAPTLSNVGTIDQRLTFTFADSANFTVVGDSLGSLGSGNTSTDWSYTHPVFGEAICILDASGWDGLTITAGATFVLDIFGAEFGYWEKNEGPAGATESGETVEDQLRGEPV